MTASRDTGLRYLGIFGSVGILVAIFLTHLYIQKDFMHFFWKIATQISRLKDKNIVAVLA